MHRSPDVRQGRTLLDQFLRANKRPSGFDYMRLVLAICIIAFHSVVICYGTAAQQIFVHDTPAKIWVNLLVPMFFTLSGFLVAGSLARTQTVFSFLGLRALRIIPALGAEILLSAIILGPLVTALPLSEYFDSVGFRAYFLNVVGDIHFYLPGVFADNPSHKVNGQLWTVPIELACYATLALLFVTGMVRRRLALAIGFAVAQVTLPLAAISAPALRGGTLGIPGWLLVLMFLSGIVIFLYRDRIAWRSGFALACFAFYVVLLYVPSGLYFIALPVGYLTVYLGLHNPPRMRLIESGDYSYGLYLYGYPIQQAVVALAPSTHLWWANILLALPLAFGFAYGSWHVLEKRSLALRRPMIAAEEWMLAALARRRATSLSTTTRY